jgi:hypothetical protein
MKIVGLLPTLALVRRWTKNHKEQGAVIADTYRLDFAT